MAARETIKIFKAVTDDDIALVKHIFLEYIEFIETHLGASISFQDTQTEFAHFPRIYDTLFLAKTQPDHLSNQQSEPIAMAACAIKPFSGSICELKRLYCRPQYRGLSLGKRLTEMALNHAKDLGYKTIYLDTDFSLIHANKIYEALGFTDIAKYYDTPLDSRFMAKTLG